MLDTKEARRLGRFVIIGGLNTLFGYLLYAGLFVLFDNVTLALLLSTIIGVLFNFKTTGHFVFENKDKSLIFLFVGVYTFVFLTNLALLQLLIAQGVTALWSQALLLPLIALLTYYLQKIIVFRT